MDQIEFSVADCLALVRQQDQHAARSLVDYLYPLVIKVVRSHLPRRAAEEDLAQEIFLKMFANLDQYRAEVPLEHWVSRIAVNHCLNAIRAQKSRPEWRMADLSEEQAEALEAVTTFTTEQSDPSRVIAARELVERLLGTLNAKDRLVIQMLEIEEKSIVEIQQATGWSATLIRVRAFRARRKLNNRFGKLRRKGEW